MPKKTENEETRLFRHIVIIGGILIGGGHPVLATPMLSIRESEIPDFMLTTHERLNLANKI